MGFLAYQASVIQQLERSYTALKDGLEKNEPVDLQNQLKDQAQEIANLKMQVEHLKILMAHADSKIEAIKNVILHTGIVPDADVLLSFLS